MLISVNVRNVYQIPLSLLRINSAGCKKLVAYNLFMKNTYLFISAISFASTLMMIFLSYASYKRHKDERLMHLVEFWSSIGFNVLVAYAFAGADSQVVALSMVGWLWPLRGLRLVLEDLSSSDLFHKWHHGVLALGSVGSVGMASFGMSLTLYTIPFCVSIGAIGYSSIYEAFKKTRPEVRSGLHWTSYILMTLYFIKRVIYPVWRPQTDYLNYSFFMEFFILLGFAGTILSAYLEMMKQGQETELANLVLEKNNKLFSQSKYSELGMMSAGIAHEINNPLAVIQARTTQLLRMYRDPAKQQDMADGLQQILYTSERINRTIQGVREFVHQDDNQPYSIVGLKDLVDDVLVFCGQRLKNHGINLRFYGLENFKVRGNKIQLEQIVLNLINNSFDAIEFLPDKWIEMSVHQTDGKIQIYFKDSGNGIPPEIASRIMEPFFSTKDLRKGTGLGLAMARGIAEQHGGNLSYIGSGAHTTFMLELPYKSAEDWVQPVVH